MLFAPMPLWPCPPPCQATIGPRTLSDGEDELCLLYQMSRRNEMTNRAPPCLIPKAVCNGPVAEQVDDFVAQRLEVVGIVDQESALAILDLVFDASHSARHDRPRLPHRFRDSEAEPFREALLDNHVGAPLQRIDDGRVLACVVHRELSDLNALAQSWLEVLAPFHDVA